MHPKITSTTPTRGSFPAEDPVVSGAAGAKNVVLATNTIATNITMIPECIQLYSKSIVKSTITMITSNSIYAASYRKNVLQST